MKTIETCAVFCIFLSLLHNALGSDNSSMNSKEVSEMLETPESVLNVLFNAFVEDLTNHVEKITACLEGKPKGYKENPRLRITSLRFLEECIKGTGFDLTLQGLIRLFPETISLFLPQMSNIFLRLSQVSYLENMFKAVMHHDMINMYRVAVQGWPTTGTCNKV